MFPPEIFSEIYHRKPAYSSPVVELIPSLPDIEPSLYAHVIVHNRDADAEDQHLKFKPYQLSTLISDNPRILNYLRSLCVDLFNCFDDACMEGITTILRGLKLERIQLTLTHRHYAWPIGH